MNIGKSSIICKGGIVHFHVWLPEGIHPGFPTNEAFVKQVVTWILIGTVMQRHWGNNFFVKGGMAYVGDSTNNH